MTTSKTQSWGRLGLAVTSIDPSRSFGGNTLFRAYSRVFEGVPPPHTRGFAFWKHDICPICGSELDSRQIEEIWDGPMSLTQHWRFFYYRCDSPNCDYEYGKWV